jgi:predicted GH43/DUF377 family glycosyl hydrolase
MRVVSTVTNAVPFGCSLLLPVDAVLNTEGPLGRCTIGWAILDGADPSQVVARSPTALITATLPWEKFGQTPYVIFATGLKPLGNDTFLVIYGAGDSDMAAIKIHVDVK